MGAPPPPAGRAAPVRTGRAARPRRVAIPDAVAAGRRRFAPWGAAIRWPSVASYCPFLPAQPASPLASRRRVLSVPTAQPASPPTERKARPCPFPPSASEASRRSRPLPLPSRRRGPLHAYRAQRGLPAQPASPPTEPEGEVLSASRTRAQRASRLSELLSVPPGAAGLSPTEPKARSSPFLPSASEASRRSRPLPLPSRRRGPAVPTERKRGLPAQRGLPAHPGRRAGLGPARLLYQFTRKPKRMTRGDRIWLTLFAFAAA